MSTEYVLRLGPCIPGFTLGEPLIIRLGFATVIRHSEGVDAYVERTIALHEAEMRQREAKQHAAMQALLDANRQGRGG